MNGFEPLHIERGGTRMRASTITLEQEKYEALQIAQSLKYSEETLEKIMNAPTIPSIDRALVTARQRGEYAP